MRSLKNLQAYMDTHSKDIWLWYLIAMHLNGMERQMQSLTDQPSIIILRTIHASEHEYNKLHVTFRTWRSRTTNVKITVDTGLTSMSCVPTAQIDQPRYPGCRTCLDG